MVINFDQYKDRYAEEVNKAIGFIGKGVDFFAREKVRHLVKLTERHLGNTSSLNILDLGCGIGYTDSVIVSSFNMIFGGIIHKSFLTLRRGRPLCLPLKGANIGIPPINKIILLFF